ncbi:unnamed protein product, partial [Prorocentrum cordatum]
GRAAKVLTHFHSDHTVGLTRGFDAGTIYCTEVTAALITELTGVDRARVRAAPLGQPLEVGGARLTFLDADHCPGSALVAFEPLGEAGPSGAGEVTVHTGDCRASEAMRRGLAAWLAGRRVAHLLLDTTYLRSAGASRRRPSPAGGLPSWRGGSWRASPGRSSWSGPTRSGRSAPFRPWRRPRTRPCSWRLDGGGWCSSRAGARPDCPPASRCGPSTRMRDHTMETMPRNFLLASRVPWVSWVSMVLRSST